MSAREWPLLGGKKGRTSKIKDSSAQVSIFVRRVSENTRVCEQVCAFDCVTVLREYEGTWYL